MASDPQKPLLRLATQTAQDRPVGKQRSIPRPEPFPQARQDGRFSPAFDRLADVLKRDPSGLELKADPAALAPERLLVFELRGSVAAFATAVRNVKGLELVDEEELEGDEGDKAPAIYLLLPDVRALHELESLWRRWLRGEKLSGQTAWRDVFALLRDLRPWGPTDRVLADESDVLKNEISALREEALVRLELELVYRPDDAVGRLSQAEIERFVAAHAGRIISRSRIDTIAYHALLVDLPVPAIREVIACSPDGLAGLEPIMHIRPQSLATSVEVADVESAIPAPSSSGALGTPILALLDGVPVAAHPLLAQHLVVDDPFGLEPNTQVSERVHGTAMASLLVHGDRNAREAPLPRRIHVVPVMGEKDEFPPDRLIVDLVYTAVIAMVEGDTATARDVLIVNLSLGNARRPFHHQMSAWARLLDRLAYRYGLLFVVSAGNCGGPFPIPAFSTRTDYEDAPPDHRARETLRALGKLIADRRLFSPAETVNGLTVGACNSDSVPASSRTTTAAANIDPYGELRTANPSSTLGPGFGRAVKPDLLLPGGRELLRFQGGDSSLIMCPASAGRTAGLKAAAPPVAGVESREGYTSGTSAAAALASRAAHRIHDALESTYGDVFQQLTRLERAVLLKALLAHPARWPDLTANWIRSVLGPADNKQHVRQRDNIRRFLGFGIVESEDAVACAADRAVFWAAGTLPPNKTVAVSVPVPVAMGGKARPHAMSATLAWFTPTLPGRRSYRAVRLKVLDPGEVGTLGMKPHRHQPDSKQTQRGTLYMRCWSGSSAPAVGPNMSVQLTVQRDPDQGVPIDEAVPFGLAVTLTMPGVVEIYDQVRQRLGIPPRTSV